MGMAWFPFFGDASNEELRKELDRVDAEISKLNAQRAELVKELEKRDCSAKG